MEPNELQTPFFAQFLEGDEQAQHADVTKPAKDLLQTQKYPSDGDEDSPADWIS
jgi:hypothetical protein